MLADKIAEMSISSVEVRSAILNNSKFVFDLELRKNKSMKIEFNFSIDEHTSETDVLDTFKDQKYKVSIVSTSPLILEAQK